VTVVDSLGGSVTGRATLEVDPFVPAPIIGAFLASRQPLLAGETTTLQVYLDGGLAPFHYFYDGLPRGCGTADTGNLTCTPGSSGLYRVTVTVADAHGRETSASLLLQVGPSGNWVAVAASNPMVWVGGSLAAGVTAGLLAGWTWRGRRNRPPPGGPGPAEATPPSPEG